MSNDNHRDDLIKLSSEYKIKYRSLYAIYSRNFKDIEVTKKILERRKLYAEIRRIAEEYNISRQFSSIIFKKFNNNLYDIENYLKNKNRKSRILDSKGQKANLNDLCKELNCNYSTIYSIFKSCKKNIEKTKQRYLSRFEDFENED
jgi:predicted DNA-binding protein YlxM (UPF0122 family)